MKFFKILIHLCRSKASIAAVTIFLTATVEASLVETYDENKKDAEADSGLVKLVEMIHVFFNNQQHKIEIKRFIYVK